MFIQPISTWQSTFLTPTFTLRLFFYPAQFCVCFHSGMCCSGSPCEVRRFIALSWSLYTRNNNKKWAQHWAQQSERHADNLQHLPFESVSVEYQPFRSSHTFPVWSASIFNWIKAKNFATHEISSPLNVSQVFVPLKSATMSYFDFHILITHMLLSARSKCCRWKIATCPVYPSEEKKGFFLHFLINYVFIHLFFLM